MTSALSDDRGGVLVMTAVWLPALLLIITFVVDVGNWFEHKRHLQLQADAGALAAGGAFNQCFGTGGGSTAIENVARNYSGDTNRAPGPVYNTQISNASNVHVLINSIKYWNEGGAVDHDDVGPPCVSGFVDVKATDANLPWLFGFVGNIFGSERCAVPVVGGKCVVPAINARARVVIKKAVALSGSLPLAVPAGATKHAAVLFVDEANPTTPLATQRLTRRGIQTLNGQSLERWDNVGDPASVTVASPNVGVIVVLSEASSQPSLSGTTATICSQALVICRWSNTQGLSFIHGFSTATAGTASAPVVRDVALTAPGCSDSSAPYFLLRGPCTFGVKVRLDFGTGTSIPAGAVVKIQGSGLGCPGSGNPKGCTLTYVNDPVSPDFGLWVTTTELPVLQPRVGNVAIDLNWKTDAGSGTFTQIHRVYAADDAAGPVAFMETEQCLNPPACTSTRNNLLEYGAQNDIYVAIGLRGRPELSGPSDPPVLLRFASGSGSGNYALDCDPGRNFREQIRTGCMTTYALNPGEACPNATTPLNCVLTQPGDASGQLSDGMDDRFFNQPANTCAANNYPTINPGDPRIVPLILTSYGAFSASGREYVPVLDFAVFYVGGWDSKKAACDAVNTAPPAGAGTRDIWGYFITYIDTIGGSTGGPEDCNFTESRLCVVTMTN